MYLSHSNGIILNKNIRSLPSPIIF
uniref:Uncharacterized protein n=1 Tax=Anguilla anguilla TaxID=7936 RepID=A0A0E9TCE4_ANGAN